MNISKENLLSVVRLVAPLASPRNGLPCLLCVRLEAVDNVLKVRATDLECDLELKVPCDGYLEPILLNARLFLALVECAADGIELMQEGATMSFKSGSHYAKLQTLPIEEYPAARDGDYRAIGFAPPDLIEPFEAVCFGASLSRPGGLWWHDYVRIQFGPQSIRCDGSNGRVFATATKPTIAGEAEVLVRHGAVKHFLEAIKVDGATLGVSEKWNRIQSPSMDFYWRNPEYNYPELEKIEKDWKMAKSGTVSASEFLSEASICNGFRDDKYTAISIVAEPKRLVLRMLGAISDYSGQIDGKFKAAKVCVDSEYLKRCLSNFSKESEVIISIEDDVKPVAIMLSEGNLRVFLATMSTNIYDK